ncbi:MAG: DnaA protein [Bacteriophage sp.]|nr:MAG: DnaA protein [Bacteriophage sp.]
MFYNMKNIDLYRELVEAVSNETGIKENDLLHSNSEEAVDARYILIHLLSQKLTDGQISTLTKLTRQSVNKIRNNFQYKIKKWSVATNLQHISNEVATE